MFVPKNFFLMAHLFLLVFISLLFIERQPPNTDVQRYFRATSAKYGKVFS